jgi:hypothetical protein
MIVRDFHRVIGVEARRQILEREERLPDLLIACVGGGSNSIGLFHPFLGDTEVKMTGVEAGGEGIVEGRHAARFEGGKLGVLQGTKTMLLSNSDGQIMLTHSVSAGLDYANFFFSACFGVELLLKLCGEGPRLYFSDSFNIFDCAVVLLSFLDIAMTQTAQAGGGGSLLCAPSAWRACSSSPRSGPRCGTSSPRCSRTCPTSRLR